LFNWIEKYKYTKNRCIRFLYTIKRYAFKVKDITNDSYSLVYVPDYSTTNLYLFPRGSFRPEPSKDPYVHNNVQE